MACLCDRVLFSPSYIIAEGYACGLLVGYGVRCENEYQAIADVCPDSWDKADWIFNMLYKMTGSCTTMPSSTTLGRKSSLQILHPTVKPRCLDRRGTPDTCIGDRSISLATSVVAQGYACQKLSLYGIDCARDYPKIMFECPDPRDLADWIFSTSYAVTGICSTVPYAAEVVTRDALASENPAVKPACLERMP